MSLRILVFKFGLLLFLTSLTTSSPLPAGENSLTPYEVLQSYGFPKGILPIGATGYQLEKSTGKFKAFLNGSCSFSLEGSYDLKYKSTIGGVISKRRLTNLTGVSVKVFFVWLNIVEVWVTDDELNFSVGIASAGFPIDNFELCPQCGCGLDCNGVGVDQGKIRTNLFVSSM